jgi:prepilin-type N-terminal cleavage/methylation domain-containing protein
MSKLPIHSRDGMTLIELLIVVAIISLLLQIALPAVEMSREASRRTACVNNLRQIGLGAQLHLNSHSHYPSGGWSYRWVGDPNRGFGARQPGGWAYNLLPFLEETSLHDLGKGLSDSARRKLAAQMFSTPVPAFVCPSRRLVRAWPYRKLLMPFNIETEGLEEAGRSDYAANVGNRLPKTQGGEGPVSLKEGDNWQNGNDRTNSWVAFDNNGVIYQRSEISTAMITRGLSKTYLCGEKYVYSADYETEGSYADDQSLYIGFDRDNQRSVHSSQPPVQDNQKVSNDLWNFGSAHQHGFNMACCDGSIRLINYSIDIQAYSAMGGRNVEEIGSED